MLPGSSSEDSDSPQVEKRQREVITETPERGRDTASPYKVTVFKGMFLYANVVF